MTSLATETLHVSLSPSEFGAPNELKVKVLPGQQLNPAWAGIFLAR